MKAYAVLILLCTAAQFWSGTALAWSKCKYIVDLPPGVSQEVRDNALLQVSKLFDEAIPYDQITPEHYESALGIVLKSVHARIQLFKADSSVPTFQNTIEALEFMWEPAGELLSFFDHLELLQPNEQLSELLAKIAPLLRAMERSILSDARIFEKVDHLYQKRDSLGLNNEELALLKNTHQAFIDEGAELNPDEQTKLADLQNEIYTLEEQYDQNLEDLANDSFLFVKDAKHLRGLPAQTIEKAQEFSIALGKTGGWAFHLADLDYAQVMTNCENRSLRERMWRAAQNAHTRGRYSNTKIVIQVAKLRHQISLLLGSKSHAESTLKDRMARTPERATHFLTQLAEKVRPQAEEELRTLSDFAGFQIEPWDVLFYEARVSTERFRVEDAELRAFFSLETVLKGAFQTAERLYGVQITARNDLPTWDDSVRAYAVNDKKTGTHLGLFYIDPYAREGKGRGTFMTTLRDGSLRHGKRRRPHVIQVHQFPPPRPGKVMLLSLQEVRYVFHEFGHVLHGICPEVSYPSIGGVNVAWDFVELPSQLFELLATDPEVMQSYAKHYQTGQVIPFDRMMRLISTERGFRALHELKSLEYAAIDLKLHSEEAAALSNGTDLMELESRAGAQFRLLNHYNFIKSTDLDHIITGGYSAGYYGYAWAMILAEKAYAYLVERGVLSPEVASHFRREILEKGGSRDPNELFLAFENAIDRTREH